jgi:hypothetical protein
MAVNASEQTAPTFRVHGVRYQIRDVSRAGAFYTQQLGSMRFRSDIISGPGGKQIQLLDPGHPAFRLGTFARCSRQPLPRTSPPKANGLGSRDGRRRA